MNETLISISVSIVALVFSVIAIVLTSMKEGIGLALGFRESETTRTKLKNIKDSLEKEVNQQILTFFEENKNKKEIDPKIRESISTIALDNYYTTLGDILLELITRFMSRFLKQLVSIVAMIFLTLFYFVYYASLGVVTDFFIFIFGIVYIILTSSAIYMAIGNAKKYFYVRLAFQRLSEEPTYDRCKELDEWLETKGISF